MANRAMSGKTLYTVGYEGARISEFVATLKAHEIEQVIDVRDLPLSRKPGFSKNALAAALASAEIHYLHLKSLGDPKAGRAAARKGNMSAFRKIYRRHLATDEAQAGLAAAADAARTLTSSLLCFERDHTDCHRTIIANELSEKFMVRHINVIAAATSQRKKSIGYSAGVFAIR